MQDNRIKVFSKPQLQEEIKQEAQIKEKGISEKISRRISEITSRRKFNDDIKASNRKSPDKQLDKSKRSSKENSVIDEEFSFEGS
jgi:hypothetical protein